MKNLRTEELSKLPREHTAKSVQRQKLNEVNLISEQILLTQYFTTVW